MKKLFRLYFIFFTLISIPLFSYAKQIQLVSQTQTPDTYELTFDINLPANDSMYHDYLSFSVDHPDVSIENWKTSIEPISKYDTTFKKNKKIFTEPFNITVILHAKNPDIRNANLYVTYYLKSQKKITQKLFPLALQRPTQSSTPEESDRESIEEKSVSNIPVKQSRSWSTLLSDILATTNSWWIRLLLALLLGFLLSLTPCIYPMIPITMGILQSQGSKSVLRNFLLALTYTTGIATTFALLGTTAAFSGKMFGNIMHNPFMVILIVALIVYLAGSMIGWYELYIPSWLQPKQKTAHGASFISIFMFGMVSGTVASPCLSPGLLLLLTMVTTFNNLLFGFGLLFMFGLGLGIPLIIIGTFSGALNVLPRAGQWMVDIKQIFGFIMLATSFYFLQAIVPWHILAILFWLLTLSVGIFYLYSSQRTTQPMKLFKNMLGIALIALSIYLFFYAYKTTSLHYNPCGEQIAWIDNYEQACTLACNEHKKLLIDISAPCCSMCSAIDKKIFGHQTIIEAFKAVIPVRIQDIEATEQTVALQKKYAVMGTPTILLIDPDTHEELHRWGAELYDIDVNEFAKQLT